MNELDSVVKEFLVESYENLDQLDRDLVVLEKDPQNRERLASIFRTIHTIKGTCGFFGFSKLESLTHVGENLLSRLRDGLLLLNPEITSALLAMIDAVRKILACIENSGQEGEGNYGALIDTLARLQEPPETQAKAEKSAESAHTKSETAATTPSQAPADVPKASSTETGEVTSDVRAQLADTKVAAEQAQAAAKAAEAAAKEAAEGGKATPQRAQQAQSLAQRQQQSADPRRHGQRGQGRRSPQQARQGQRLDERRVGHGLVGG